MKIKMLTTSAGPDVSLNWMEGEERTLEDSEAQALIDSGLAVSLEMVIPEDETDFADGGFTARHRGGGSWQVLDASGNIVAEGLKKDEAKSQVEELNAPSDEVKA